MIVDPDRLIPPAARPDLIGQDGPLGELADAVASGRLSHAWLLTGPYGVGKATAAFRVARHLLDPTVGEGARLDDSGAAMTALASPSGRLVAASSHPDLLVVERPAHGEDKSDLPTWLKRRQGELAADRVRKATRFLSQTAAAGGWRVVIIDEGETLNRFGANALLKILEEPPDRALLMVICSNAGALPVTVRSRCRHLRLQALTPAAMGTILSPAIADPTQRDRLIAVSAGSAGRAVRYALADIGAVTDILDGIVAGYPRLDGVAAHALAERLGGAAADLQYRALCDLLVGRLADLAKAKADPGRDIGLGEGWRRLAETSNLDRLLELWDKTARMLEQSDRASLDRQQTVLQALNLLAPAA